MLSDVAEEDARRLSLEASWVTWVGSLRKHGDSGAAAAHVGLRAILVIDWCGGAAVWRCGALPRRSRARLIRSAPTRRELLEPRRRRPRKGTGTAGLSRLDRPRLPPLPRPGSRSPSVAAILPAQLRRPAPGAEAAVAPALLAGGRGPAGPEGLRCPRGLPLPEL